MSENNFDFKIIEKNSFSGGRVYSENKDGFILDEGFQIFLDNYPESKKLFDYEKLKLKNFHSGALVHIDNQFYHYLNPLFHPLSKQNKLWNELLGLILISKNVLLRNIDTDLDTDTWIKNFPMVSKEFKMFVKSFLKGVLLDKKLCTKTSIALDYLKLFVYGRAAVPYNGMIEFTNQLKKTIPIDKFVFNEEVVSVKNNTVITKSGNHYNSQNIIFATDLNSVNEIFNLKINITKNPVTNIYFRTSENLSNFPGIILNANSNEIINHLSILNLINPNYSFPGENLISVSLFNESSYSYNDLIQIVLLELREWYGNVIDELELIRIKDHFNDIPFNNLYKYQSEIREIFNSNVFFCGGYLSNSSIEGAIKTSNYLINNCLFEQKRCP